MQLYVNVGQTGTVPRLSSKVATPGSENFGLVDSQLTAGDREVISVSPLRNSNYRCKSEGM